jgi:hypothetical protein
MTTRLRFTNVALQSLAAAFRRGGRPAQVREREPVDAPAHPPAGAWFGSAGADVFEFATTRYLGDETELGL